MIYNTFSDAVNTIVNITFIIGSSATELSYRYHYLLDLILRGRCILYPPYTVLVSMLVLYSPPLYT